MRKHLLAIAVTLITTAIFTACGESEEEGFIPKPRSYFRIEFPDKDYQAFEDDCPYTFNYPSYSHVVQSAHSNPEQCFKNIMFPYYKATMFCTYLKLDSTSDFQMQSEYSRGLAYEHRVKASGIQEREYLNYDKGVYGTTYEIQGEAACNYLFYLSDSTEHFFSASLYFEVIPNYDSLKPVIDYIKQDIQVMIESFEWKNS